MGIREIRRTNMLALFEGLDQQRFRTLKEQADHFGVDPSVASQIKNESRAMGESIARRIEQAGGLEEGWMDVPHAGTGEAKARYGSEEEQSVPLISWVAAGQWIEAVDPWVPGEGEKKVYTTRRVGPKAFALRVHGDSMENPSGRPTYPAGCIIVVDPDAEAMNGSRVVIRLVNSKEATFKQLVMEGGERYLKPLNPRYPVMPIIGEAVICGVVVETQLDQD